IAKGDVQAVNYFVAQKYVDALKTIGAAPNQKVILLPMETAGVMGTVAGVMELTKASAAAGGASAPPPPPEPEDNPNPFLPGTQPR
ncbi:MAG: band-7 C-terminal domain-containing protein, partial [Pseudomonadota bacterium]